MRIHAAQNPARFGKGGFQGEKQKTDETSGISQKGVKRGVSSERPA